MKDQGNFQHTILMLLLVYRIKLFQQGDIITQIGDEEIGEKTPFINILLKHKLGERVKVKYYRDNDERSVLVVLGKTER